MPFDGTDYPYTEVQRTLIAARALIEQGWCQGRMVRFIGQDKGQHSYCIIGALRETKAPLRVLAQAEEALRTSRINCPNDRPLHHWNDRKGRTKEEVLDLFDKAIVKAG